MRLIHAKTKELHEFIGNAVPEYAILSHTWGSDEISFQDLCDYNERGKSGESAKAASLPTRKPGGWSKIEGTCKLTLARDIEYAWIDTCCIDKSSSAELQEAINSMFGWYEGSKVCFAFLEDIWFDKEGHPRQFKDSRWFTRGWTLQELLAPLEVMFYDQNWGELGTKHLLSSVIAQTTGINEDFILSNPRERRRLTLMQASVAERFSWAAKRETTRIEDRAYSLLGIFDINMPMLYGEGTKAFTRLQEEIMKISDDPSLLAWSYGRYLTDKDDSAPAILARSPDDFMYCGRMRLQSLLGYRRPKFSMTPRGMQAELAVFHTEKSRSVGRLSYAILGAAPAESKFLQNVLVLPLLRNREVGEAKELVCVRTPWVVPEFISRDVLDRIAADPVEQTVLIRRTGYHPALLYFDPLFTEVSFSEVGQGGFSVTSVYPPQPLCGQLMSLDDPNVVNNKMDPSGLDGLIFKAARAVSAFVPSTGGDLPPPYSSTHDDGPAGNLFYRLKGTRKADFVVVLSYRIVRKPLQVGNSSFSNTTVRVFRLPPNKTRLASLLEHFAGYEASELTSEQIRELGITEIPSMDGNVCRATYQTGAEPEDADWQRGAFRIEKGSPFLVIEWKQGDHSRSGGHIYRPHTRFRFTIESESST